MWHVLLCLWFVASSASAETGQVTSQLSLVAMGNKPVQELLLAVRVNHEDLPEAVLLKVDGFLYAGGRDLERWRLLVPSNSPKIINGNQTFYSLQALPSITYQMDEAKQQLFIKAKSDAFVPTRINGSALRFSKPFASAGGGFMNYDVSVQSQADTIQLNSLFELGVFNEWGVGIANFLAGDLTENARYIRLDSTWTIDKPEQLASFRLGDSISNAGSWGRSVRFAGIQWATNFQTQPGFITFPLPQFEGETALPSSVDLFVENSRLLNSLIPSGPFFIDNVPVMTGLREMQLVVRDMLGHEQRISQPYYASPRLLRPKLQEFSYEIGSVRQNYGRISDDYDGWFAAATQRLGISERLTGEWHAELMQNQQNIGIGSVFLAPMLGVFDAAIAGSHGEQGVGGLLALGFERQTSWLSFGGHAQLTSRRFTQLGSRSSQSAPRISSSWSLGLSNRGYGSVSINHIYQEYRDHERVNLVNAIYNLQMGKRWSLSLSAFSSLSDDNHGASVVLNHSVGRRSTVSVTARTNKHSSGAMLQLQRNLPPGNGFGYRVLAGYEKSERIEAGISLQNDIGRYDVEVARYQAKNYLRSSASGGITVMRGDLFLSRRINNSFAVVQVPGFDKVRVYAENQLVATTDAEGNALVPNLRSYQQNHIRIEQADLPLDAQIDALSSNASPYFRSGSLLEFPVRHSRGATLQIVLDNGQPLPAGATAQLVGQTQIFPVALQGKVYITGLAPANRLQVHWRQQQCQLDIMFPESEEPQPDLGSFICHGVDQ